MQITLVQHEIETAIRNFVLSLVATKPGEAVTIDMEGRGSSGIRATVDLTPAELNTSQAIPLKPVSQVVEAAVKAVALTQPIQVEEAVQAGIPPSPVEKDVQPAEPAGKDVNPFVRPNIFAKTKPTETSAAPEEQAPFEEATTVAPVATFVPKVVTPAPVEETVTNQPAVEEAPPVRKAHSLFKTMKRPENAA